jgi:hypothetical protein
MMQEEIIIKKGGSYHTREKGVVGCYCGGLYNTVLAGCPGRRTQNDTALEVA